MLGIFVNNFPSIYYKSSWYVTKMASFFQPFFVHHTQCSLCSCEKETYGVYILQYTCSHFLPIFVNKSGRRLFLLHNSYFLTLFQKKCAVSYAKQTVSRKYKTEDLRNCAFSLRAISVLETIYKTWRKMHSVVVFLRNLLSW